ncbi:MAG: Trm112 family protein [archaeon]
MLKEHLELLICPDCKGDLKKIGDQKTIVGFYCSRCGIIYPVKEEGIPIILAKEARNFDLDFPLLKKIEKKLSNKSFDELHKLVKKTLHLLEPKKGILTYAWEDESFWSRKYVGEMSSGSTKNWNDRIWQRDFLVKELMD